MPNVDYLEVSDFNNGLLRADLLRGRPAIVMVQSMNCPHCTDAKPDFNQLPNNCNVYVATLQAEKTQPVAQPLMQSVNAQGVPTYLCFNREGKLLGSYNGGRKLADLVAYTSTMN